MYEINSECAGSLYSLPEKYFVKDLFSWLFLTVTVSEDEIGLCPFLLTGALIPECEPGVQPGASLRPG